MVLEATLVCFDNSEHTRNADFAPTRFQAQADAVNLLAGAKTQSNPESTVGVLTMAGKTPRVLVTPTPDLGKVLNAMQDLQIEGEINLSTAVQIAQLALKHRQNKNQRQRIVIFIGSPLTETKVRPHLGRYASAHCCQVRHRLLCCNNIVRTQAYGELCDWISRACSSRACSIAQDGFLAPDVCICRTGYQGC